MSKRNLFRVVKCRKEIYFGGGMSKEFYFWGRFPSAGVSKEILFRKWAVWLETFYFSEIECLLTLNECFQRKIEFFRHSTGNRFLVSHFRIPWIACWEVGREPWVVGYAPANVVRGSPMRLGSWSCIKGSWLCGCQRCPRQPNAAWEVGCTYSYIQVYTSPGACRKEFYFGNGLFDWKHSIFSEIECLRH